MATLAGTTLDLMLRTLAGDTWENLREAWALSVRYGEETITDFLMLGLRRKGFTVFKQTPLRDEARYGTDFECWIGSDSIGWIGYAVQAKKLDFRTGSYRNLGHVVKGPGKRQIDILETYAKNRGMTARYCLYSHSYVVDKAFLRCCSRDYLEEELGCTIAPLYAVERAIWTTGGKSFPSLQSEERTVPWRCLTLCPLFWKSLVSKSISSDDLSPLLDIDTTIHPRLPNNLGNLVGQIQTEVQPQLPDDQDNPLPEGHREVDFEELGIGVDSREMGFGDQISPTFIVPKRVYILELPQEELDQQLSEA